MKAETTDQPGDQPHEQQGSGDSYGHTVNTPSQVPSSLATVLRIGLVYYNQNRSHSASGHVILECVICEQTFPLQSICGVAADKAYAFVGNVCFDCLATPVPGLRQLLHQTAARLRERAARCNTDDEEQVIASRLLIEAASREQWAVGDLLHSGNALLTRARTGDIAWKKYGLLKELTTITYQAWFDELIDDIQP